eukprot:m.199935 g.199935  ORF g.199935 m.199935 type:complete len:200 (-) comp18397_c1_seq16:286-885(-)
MVSSWPACPSVRSWVCCSGAVKNMAGNDSALYKHIEPLLKHQLNRIYLRETSAAEWEKQQRDPGQVASARRAKAGPSQKLELPFYSKYLLCAAFIASYNPASTDRALFSKRSSSRKKSRRRTTASASSRHLLGPKAFPLDRLFAIFYSILDETSVPTAETYIQVGSLVSLKLLAKVAYWADFFFSKGTEVHVTTAVALP